MTDADRWERARAIVNRRMWGNLDDDVVVKRCHDTAVACVAETLRECERPDVLIAVRFYLESDPLVQVWQIAYDAREGEPFVNMCAGEILDAMHDTSGVRYGYTVGACDLPDHIALAPLVRQARNIAAEHRT